MADQTQATKIEDRAARPAKNIMRRRPHDEKREAPEFEERVIEVSRVARTVKGGRRIRFRALVVIGNRKGKIGIGLGKSTDVSEAVRKAVSQAKKKLITIPIIDGTIPYEVISKFGSAVVMLKPAASGTSIVAGGCIRAVADLAGITDLLSKMMGSPNKVNNIVATIKALSSFNPAYTERVQKMSERNAAKTTVNPEVKPVIEEKKEEVVAVEKKPKAEVKKAAKKKA